MWIFNKLTNIIIEFTRNDKRFNENKLILDFYEHIKNNWYRLVDYGIKGNKIRVYSNFRDIKDMALDFKNYKAIGYKKID